MAGLNVIVRTTRRRRESISRVADERKQFKHVEPGGVPIAAATDRSAAAVLLRPF